MLTSGGSSTHPFRAADFCVAHPHGAGTKTAQRFVALAAGNHTGDAAEFVAFLASKEPMAKYSAFFPPIRESVLTPEILVGASKVLTPELVQPIIDGVKANGQVFPVAKSNAAVAAELNSSLDEFLYQPGADVSAALGKVCEAVAPLLK